MLYNEKQFAEYVADFAGTLTSVTFALIFGLSSGSIFMQKGYDGINILSKLISKTDLDASGMNIWSKIFMGLSSGIGSGTLYGVSASQFPKLFFVMLPTYLWHHPKHIATAALFVVANYFASSSMQNVTASVLARENNIIPFLSSGFIGQAMPYVVRAGGGFVNCLGELKTFAEPTANSDHPTYDEVVRHFNNPDNHRIEPGTADSCAVELNKLSFFKPDATVPREQIPYNHSVQNFGAGQ